MNEVFEIAGWVQVVIWIVVIAAIILLWLVAESKEKDNDE